MMALLLVTALLLSGQASQSQSGRVSGQIRNTAGAPASGVRVAAMLAPRKGDANVPALVAFAMTDSAGRYTIEGIEPGTYYITAGKVDQPSYFPGVLVQSNAKTIVVAARATLSGIDFETIEPSTYAVSGRVILPSGQTPDNPSIVLVGVVNQTTGLRPDGTFEFVRVRAGTYSVRYVPSLLASTVSVVITDADIKGIELAIPAVFPVTITTEGTGSPRTSLRFSSVGKQNSFSEVTGAQTFTINLPEGEYRVFPGRTPNGYEVKSLTAGSTDLFKDTLKIARTESPIQITLTLGALPAVRFAGRANQSLRKIVLQKPGSEDVEGSIQPDGSFAFDSIAPGTYSAMITTTNGATSIETDVVVPLGGKTDHAIRILEVRRLSVRIAIEAGLAIPVVGLTFTGRSSVTSITMDGSARNAGVGVSLPDGEYKVSATLRQQTGPDAVRVKTIRYGTADLLTTPLSITENGPSEILLTLGK